MRSSCNAVAAWRFPIAAEFASFDAGSSSAELVWVNRYAPGRSDDAVELVEALAGREEFWQVTEVPFAEAGRSVADRLEYFGDRLFVGMKAGGRGRKKFGVYADAFWVTARQDGDAGWRAHGATEVEIGERHALTSHPVEVGCLVSFCAERTNVRIAHFVTKDHNEVRLGIGSANSRQEANGEYCLQNA